MDATTSGPSISAGAKISSIFLCFIILIGIILLILYFTHLWPFESNKSDISPNPNVHVIEHAGFMIQNSDIPWLIPTIYRYAYKLNNEYSDFSAPSVSVSDLSDSNPIFKVTLPTGPATIYFERKVGDNTEWVEATGMHQINMTDEFVDTDNPSSILQAYKPRMASDAENVLIDTEGHTWLSEKKFGQIPFCKPTVYSYRVEKNNYKSDYGPYSDEFKSFTYGIPIMNAPKYNPEIKHYWRQKNLLTDEIKDIGLQDDVNYMIIPDNYNSCTIIIPPNNPPIFTNWETNYKYILLKANVSYLTSTRINNNIRMINMKTLLDLSHEGSHRVRIESILETLSRELSIKFEIVNYDHVKITNTTDNNATIDGFNFTEDDLTVMLGLTSGRRFNIVLAPGESFTGPYPIMYAS